MGKFVTINFDLKFEQMTFMTERQTIKLSKTSISKIKSEINAIQLFFLLSKIFKFIFPFLCYCCRRHTRKHEIHEENVDFLFVVPAPPSNDLTYLCMLLHACLRHHTRMRACIGPAFAWSIAFEWVFLAIDSIGTFFAANFFSVHKQRVN